MVDFDVLIVGSGAGGGTAAYQLCQQGFKVGLLERGPRFDPQKDYVLNYTDWDTRPNPLANATDQEQTIDRSYRSEFTHNNKTYQRSPLLYHRVHGLGGSTLHYQGEAHRLTEHSFRSKSLFQWGSDWPISYHDLEPYYQKMERLLGVAGQTGNPFKTPRDEFPTPAQPLSKKSLVLAKSAKQIGMSLYPNTLALPSQSVDGRLPCQHSGGCSMGCVFGAKSSVDQALIPKAEQTGNLTIMTNTRVMSVDVDEHGSVVALTCLKGTKRFSLNARRYILAAGTIETPRLLLTSANHYFPNGFANQFDQVGRYFMETIMASLSLHLTGINQNYRGPPIDSRIWDFCYPNKPDLNGFVLGVLGEFSYHTAPVQHALRTAGLGRAHSKAVRETFAQEVVLYGIAEQQPVASNRVFLSESLDDDGIPKVKVHNIYSEQDQRTLAFMGEKLEAWANASNTTHQEPVVDTRIKSSATHTEGTCRMGDDPRNSVVDAYGKIHGSHNCYIADGSIMPTQGAGDSPSLTIQALALRIADRVADDLKQSS